MEFEDGPNASCSSFLASPNSESEIINENKSTNLFSTFNSQNSGINENLNHDNADATQALNLTRLGLNFHAISNNTKNSLNVETDSLIQQQISIASTIKTTNESKTTAAATSSTTAITTPSANSNISTNPLQTFFQQIVAQQQFALLQQQIQKKQQQQQQLNNNLFQSSSSGNVRRNKLFIDEILKIKENLK